MGFYNVGSCEKKWTWNKVSNIGKVNWYITGFFFNKLVFREIMKFLSLNEIKSSLYIRIVRDGYSCAATVKSITCTGSLFPWGPLYDAF